MATAKRSVLEENKAIVRRFYEEMIATGNLDLVDTLIAEEVDDWHAAENGWFPGRVGFKQHVANVHEGGGEYRLTVDDLVAEGDRVVAFWTFTRVYGRPILGVPPTGKRVTVSVVSVLRLANGQITQYRSWPDRYSFLEQVGALATPAPVPPTPPTSTR